MTKKLDRMRSKLKQLTVELGKEDLKVDFHSVAHLARDLSAAATAANSYGKLKP